MIPRLLNAVVLVVVLVANGMAGAGALSGDSIGEVANRYASYFLPSGYVFGIWSLIYLWLMAFVVYQLLPAGRDDEAVDRIGAGWWVNGLLNVGWIVAFSFSQFGPALLIMIGLLVSLIWINERIGLGTRDLTFGQRAFVAYPFSLYLAWISVALIANTFQFVNYLEWSGFGIPGSVWSPVMMVVATGLSAFMVLHRGQWLFPLVFAWAFIGIADRYPDVPGVRWTAYVASAVGLVVLVGGLVWRRRRGRLAT